MAKLNKFQRLCKCLDKWEVPIVEAMYGKNGKEMLSATEILETFDITEEELKTLKEKIKSIEQNELKFNGYQLDSLPKELQKTIDNMSAAFYAMFPGVEPLEVEKCLYEKLELKQRKILFLYYGLDGLHCLDYDEIADKYKITVDEVDEIIETSISIVKALFSSKKKAEVSKKTVKVKKVTIKDICEYGKLVNMYGEERVKEAFSQLRKQERVIVELFYKSPCATVSDIAEYLGMKKQSVFYILNRAGSKVKNFLQNNRR